MVQAGGRPTLEETGGTLGKCRQPESLSSDWHTSQSRHLCIEYPRAQRVSTLVCTQDFSTLDFRATLCTAKCHNNQRCCLSRKPRICSPTRSSVVWWTAPRITPSLFSTPKA